MLKNRSVCIAYSGLTSIDPRVSYKLPSCNITAELDSRNTKGAPDGNAVECRPEFKWNRLKWFIFKKAANVITNRRDVRIKDNIILRSKAKGTPAGKNSGRKSLAAQSFLKRKSVEKGNTTPYILMGCLPLAVYSSLILQRYLKAAGRTSFFTRRQPFRILPIACESWS